MSLKIFLTSTLVVGLLGCASYPSNAGEPEPGRRDDSPSKGAVASASAAHRVSTETTKSTDSDYVLGPGDSLKITVWGHDDLTRSVQISEEGNFSYPLIGKVHADGLSVSQVEQEITGRLSGKYLINPQLTIVVEEFKSKQVFVLGEVGGPQGHGKGPGAYPLTGHTSLIEVLSAAGGLTPEAGSEVIVVRPSANERVKGPLLPQESGAAKITKLNVKRLLGGDATQNIFLEDGDTVYIPPAQYFFVSGQVKSPGRYVLEPDTTVLKAITMAGGFTEIASVKRTKILREENGARSEKRVQMTDSVNGQDVIIVPESFF
ncbi:polysaccharide biosynthesis/export family protein [Candidatus Poribacteria bacterium]|nr:polysaccharide biosynthesis/export family protein [Candidatus Poribacteria bacterium]